MGTWGAGAFANDDAMDWLVDLESARDLRIISDALAAVTDVAGYIEAPVGSIALAAGEVVAALRGRPSPDLPPEVSQWVQAHALTPDRGLLDLARRAVASLSSDHERSELQQLWAEAAAEDRDAWADAVADLQSRLA
ncbi:MAG TPA: DUF4259 domain-containing protein [Gemmatimonadaceae bacterium]|jgi:hypothetical protein